VYDGNVSTAEKPKKKIWHVKTAHIFQQSLILVRITDIIQSLVRLLYQSKKEPNNTIFSQYDSYIHT
jgi:hypothetical protein